MTGAVRKSGTNTYTQARLAFQLPVAAQLHKEKRTKGVCDGVDLHLQLTLQPSRDGILAQHVL